MGKRADASLRRALRAHPGHGMMELGCHLVDLTVTLLGVPSAVRAEAERSESDGLPDRQRAALRYAWGEASLSCDHADITARRWLTIAGTRGTIRVPSLEGNVVHMELAAAAGTVPARHDRAAAHRGRTLRGRVPGTGGPARGSFHPLGCGPRHRRPRGRPPGRRPRLKGQGGDAAGAGSVNEGTPASLR